MPDINAIRLDAFQLNLSRWKEEEDELKEIASEMIQDANKLMTEFFVSPNNLFIATQNNKYVLDLNDWFISESGYLWVSKA
jgi:hypothetical protein